MIELTKKAKWSIWRPHKGRYYGKSVYVSLVSYPGERHRSTPNGHNVLSTILAFYTKNKLYLHKGQITEYQFMNHCETIALTPENYKLLNDLDVKFEEYKHKWEINRLIKDVKGLLLS